ncbi:hypothetical protein AVEN_51784-1, partial [Araneus ventricosus]
MSSKRLQRNADSSASRTTNPQVQKYFRSIQTESNDIRQPDEEIENRTNPLEIQ